MTFQRIYHQESPSCNTTITITTLLLLLPLLPLLPLLLLLLLQMSVFQIIGPTIRTAYLQLFSKLCKYLNVWGTEKSGTKRSLNQQQEYSQVMSL